MSWTLDLRKCLNILADDIIILAT